MWRSLELIEEPGCNRNLLKIKHRDNNQKADPPAVM